MEAKVQQFVEMVRASNNIVFFGGAGVSTESGIPDFRSEDGLYRQSYAYPPETILSHSFFMAHPGEFYRFYREKMLCLSAKPNAAHRTLARLEAEGRCKAVVTQNIDGLHQAAGSANVVEYHGGVRHFFCMGCGAEHDGALARELPAQALPWRCEDCGGVVRPDIVFFGEAIALDALTKSGQLALAADVIVVAGTSGEVAPANLLPREVKARGGGVVEINLTESAFKGLADVRLKGRAEVVLPALIDRVLS